MRNGKIVVKPWMGILGLFGFLGFIGFFTSPTFLVFFGFFGFFSYYWEGKLAKEMQDERLNENRQKAIRIAYQTGLCLAFTGMILIGNIWGSNDPAKAYAALNTVISLAFALSTNLSFYLAYKFDKDGCEDE